MAMDSYQSVWLATLMSVVALAASGGCTTAVPQTSGDPAPLDQLASAVKCLSGAGEDEATRDRHADDELLASLVGEPNWIHSVPSSAGEEPPYRWVYPAFEGLLLEHYVGPKDLAVHLGNADPVVSANAAIGLARLGDPSVAGVLSAAAGNMRLPPRLRSAAVETLGQIPDSVALLEGLVDQENGRADRTGGGYSPTVHAELVRVLGTQARAGDEPRLTQALSASADDVVLAALEVWQEAPVTLFPQEGLALLDHPDPRIRARLPAVLAQHPASDTLLRLTAALADPDLRVRAAAIRALGVLGDEQAVAKLKPLLTEGVEAERAAAVEALADLGQAELVAAAAGDKAWRVRLVVAEVFARLPGKPNTGLARKLLDDSSGEVQLRTVESIRIWPASSTEPLFLEALEGGSYRSQKLAAESLAESWPELGPRLRTFPFGRPPEVRAPVIAELRRTYVQRGRSTESQAEKPLRAEAAFSSEQLISVAASILALQSPRIDAGGRQEALTNLRRHRADLADMLEYLVKHRGVVLPEIVYSTVLAESAPEFAELEQFRRDDVLARRNASQQLAQDLGARRPGPLFLRRLADVAATETDGVVWQNLLTAISRSDDEPAFRLAYAALCHESSGVRLAACEHLGRYPRPEHATALLAVLDDSSVSVACAAMEALGKCGGDVNCEPIVQLLGSRNEDLQIAAAIVLTRFHRSEGPAALERLAYSHDERTRIRVAQAMGELALSEFASTLLRLLDDRHGVQLAALESLAAVADCPEAEAPGLHQGDQIRAWRHWASRRTVTARTTSQTPGI